jgi:Chaperone of endosialidase/Domain of unknown function (DUF5011)
MPSSYGRAVAAVVFVFVLTFSSYAHADTGVVPIGNPYTDTLQLWSNIISTVEALANDLATSLFSNHSQAANLNGEQPQRQHPSGVAQSAAAALATQSGSNTATSSTNQNPFATSGEAAPNAPSDQTTNSSDVKSAAFITTSNNSAPFSQTSNFVTQDELTAQLQQLSNAFTAKFSTPATSPVPQNVAAGGNATVPYAGANAIDNLSDVTITNANLTASEIPTNIVASNYLPLSGGTLTGTLSVPTLSASSTSYGTFAATDASTTVFSNFGTAYFGGSATTTIDAAGDLTVAGTLIANGNVGIGTTSPGSLLSLNNIANFTTATSTFYSDILTSGTTQAGLFRGAGAVTGAFLITGDSLQTGPAFHLNGANNTYFGLSIGPSTAGLTGGGEVNAMSVGATFSPTYRCGMARGTVGSLTATQNNDYLCDIEYNGYTGSAWGLAVQEIAQAAQNWGINQLGSQWRLRTVAIGSGTLLDRIVIDGNGNTGIKNGALNLYDRGDNCCAEQSFIEGNNIWSFYGLAGGGFRLYQQTNNAGGAGVGTVMQFSDSGNVGIGTSTPYSTLTVWGPDTSASTLPFQVVNSASTTLLDVTDSGNVGLGTTSPWGLLSAQATANSSSPEFVVGSTTADSLVIANNGYVGIGTTSPLTKLSVQGTAGANDLLNIASSTGASLLYVNATGNVGVGTAAPIAKLDVEGGIATIGDRGDNCCSELNFDEHNHGIGKGLWSIYMKQSSGTLYFYQQFNASGAAGVGQDVTFANNGYVGIGTTTPYSELTVWGLDTASTSAFLVANSASTTEFNVLDNGNATLAGSLIQNSDQRLKTNITPLDASSSLGEIEQLNAVTFNWIDPEKGTGPQLGFIAQQVQQVFPNLVSTTSPTALTPNGTLSLDYIGLISPIVSAIQALSSELSSIENTIEGFANSFTTNELTFNRATGQELCLQQSNGNPVCLTGDQLAALLSAAGASQTTESVSQGDPSNSLSTSSESVSSTTPPVIQINGDNPAIVQVGETYNDLGATITGPQADLKLGVETYVNGVEMDPVQLDTSQVATDTIDYVATDQNGLTSTSTRTVIIEAAAIAPSIVPTDDASTTATASASTTATSTAQ